MNICSCTEPERKSSIKKFFLKVQWEANRSIKMEDRIPIKKLCFKRRMWEEKEVGKEMVF